MTDTYIEQQIIERFLTITDTFDDGDNTPVITSPVTDTDGNVTYPNIQFPNMSFKRPVSGIWFEIFFLPSMPQQQEIFSAGRNRWNGLVQINVNYPKDSGTYEPNFAFDCIAGKFRRGDIFNGIRVQQSAYRSSALIHDDYYSMPVTIWCQADLDN